jgi:hypothetical protein
MNRLLETCVVLDALGWPETEHSQSDHVDVSEHGWGLVQALIDALDVADEDISKKACDDLEQRGLAALREFVGALREFLSVVEVQIEARAVTDEDTALVDVAG